MQKHKLRTSVVRAAAVGAAALSATLTLGAGVASAAPADPTGGATPVAPTSTTETWRRIRDSGSDTTFFMMQKISDLYTGAGLYGCTLNPAHGRRCTTRTTRLRARPTSSSTASPGQNIDTTDVNDNWDRTEVAQGVDNVGSGAGQNQLCGAATDPAAGRLRPVLQAGRYRVLDHGPDRATPRTAWRSSTFSVNPTTIGAGASTTAPYSSINGGVVGPVSSGLAAR